MNKTAKAKPLQFLGSMDFFAHLRGALRKVGLSDEALIRIAVGIYAVGISRHLPYPLRLTIPKEKHGSTQLIEKIARLFCPGSLVTVDLTEKGSWDAFAAAPNRKLIFIPRWMVEGPNGRYAFLQIQKNKLIRVMGTKKDVKETIDEVEGTFACVTNDSSPNYSVLPRWLTSKAFSLAESSFSKSTLTAAEEATWHEIDRLLKSFAQLPMRFPQWEQIVMEQMCEMNSRAGHYIPVLLQAWQSVCLLRSFKYDLQLKRLEPSFRDLAATTLLFPQQMYREASRFPSPRNIFNQVSQPGEMDSVQNPLGGNGRRYRRKREPLRIQSILGLNAELDQHGWLISGQDLVLHRELEKDFDERG